MGRARFGGEFAGSAGEKTIRIHRKIGVDAIQTADGIDLRLGEPLRRQERLEVLLERRIVHRTECRGHCGLGRFGCALIGALPVDPVALADFVDLGTR